ncbi:MAG: PQQ-binding-like beta-propeller repeat protein [Verrucomicrobiota bacterium]|nr:PQQ-binding-like beta-propeller repeat protein [Verrucomicrobiota bacterium]
MRRIQTYFRNTRFDWMLGIWLTLLGAHSSTAGGSDLACWPQFRGPSGQGRAPDARLTLPFGPETAVLWKREVPPGHASPCIWGDILFLSAFDSDQLTTIALNRHDGSVIWKQFVTPQEIENGHRNGTPANSTPVTDGNRVYAYFGSFGLVAYNFQGVEQWRCPLPVPVTQHGASSSPILANGRILVQVDQDVDAHMLCVDAVNGAILWKAPRQGFRRGFSTPIVWPVEKPQSVIASGTLQVMAYDLEDGHLDWNFGGLPNETVASPAFDQEHLFICGWTMGSGVPRLPDYDELLEKDSDGDGRIERPEASGAARMHFPYIDADKDKHIDRQEWESMSEIFTQSQNALLALKPGTSASEKPTLSWKLSRGLPYVPSPLAYRGHVYLVKNGGLMSCLNAKTGKVVYQQERLGALGDYYASPIAVGEHILLASQRGVVTVIEAGTPELRVAYQVHFKDSIMATPAIVHEQLYIRTGTRLYCLGKPGT